MTPDELRALPDDAFEAELDRCIERSHTAMAHLLAKWQLAPQRDVDRHRATVASVTSQDLISALDEADQALEQAWAEKHRRLTARRH